MQPEGARNKVRVNDFVLANDNVAVYIEAEGESEDGNRSYSWIYRETPLSGEVESACQLVGLDDFRHPTVQTAQKNHD